MYILIIQAGMLPLYECHDLMSANKSLFMSVFTDKL